RIPIRHKVCVSRARGWLNAFLGARSARPGLRVPELIQTVHTVPAVSIARRQASESSGDLLAIPVFEKDDFASVGGVDAATGGEVSRAFQSGEFTGKLYELFFTPAGRDGWRPRRVVLVGAGPRAEYSTERLRRIAT